MQERIPQKKGLYNDDWGTGTRKGYEERSQHLPPKPTPKPRGNRLLRILGGLLIVGGMFWGAYRYTSGFDIVETLRHNHGPTLLCGVGLVLSVLGKYLRL